MRRFIGFPEPDVTSAEDSIRAINRRSAPSPSKISRDKS
jgi:hypothetical protein